MLTILAQATQPAIDALDLLNRLDAFYNAAWTKLAMLIGIGGTVVGVLIPIGINWMQQSNFRRIERRFQEGWEKELRSVRKDLEAARERIEHSVSQAEKLVVRVDLTEKEVKNGFQTTCAVLGAAFCFLAEQATLDKRWFLIPGHTVVALGLLEKGHGGKPEPMDNALLPFLTAAHSNEGFESMFSTEECSHYAESVLTFIGNRPALAIQSNAKAIRELVERMREKKASQPKSTPE